MTNYHLDIRNESSPANTSQHQFKAQIESPEVDFDTGIKQCINCFIDSEEVDDVMKQVVTFCSIDQIPKFIGDSIIVAVEKTSHESNPRELWGNFLGYFFPSHCDGDKIFEG